MRSWVNLAAALVIVSVTSNAFAVDFEEYTRLVQAAEGAHASLEGAQPGLLAALQEHALERDLAVIQWLDDFFATDEFGELGAEQQALAYRDRYRNEFNASRLLVELDRCEESRDRIRSLLDSNVQDAELRPRLTETYDDALACIARPRVALLSVTTEPPNARIIVDGEFLGLASATHEVPLGDHSLTVQADGYQDHEGVFIAQDVNQEISLGPITLVEIPAVVVSSAGPEWYHWTLWGAGAAGIGVGTALILSASSRQDDIDNPPAGSVVADPEAEQDIIDQNRMIGIISLGVGAAAAITGTVLFLIGGDDDDNQAANWGVDPFNQSVWLNFTF